MNNEMNKEARDDEMAPEGAPARHLGQKISLPSREKLRAHNRNERLAYGWANVCPVNGCGRKFTSANGYRNHLTSYHRITVSGISAMAAAEPRHMTGEKGESDVDVEDD